MVAGQHAAGLLAVDVDLVAGHFDTAQSRFTPLYHCLVVAQRRRAAAFDVMPRPTRPYLRRVRRTGYQRLDLLARPRTSLSRLVVLGRHRYVVHRSAHARQLLEGHLGERNCA